MTAGHYDGADPHAGSTDDEKGTPSMPNATETATAHHGSTPAAWTGVAIALVGFIVGGLGLLIESMTLFYIGLALGALAAIVGGVMSRMGMGAEPR